MQIDIVSALPVASAIVASISMLIAFRSSQIARNSFRLAQAVGQSAYEAAKSRPDPVITMHVDEVEYLRSGEPLHQEREAELARPVTQRLMSPLTGSLRRIKDLPDEGDFEVVVRATIQNNTGHEVLLTGRASIPIGAHNKFKVVFKKVDQMVMRPNATQQIEVVFRGSKRVWLLLNKRWSRREFVGLLSDGAYEFPPPQIFAWLEREFHYFFRLRYKTQRCEFWLVCEARFSERVATVWKLQVRRSPVAVTEDDSDEVRYVGLEGVLYGPFDDTTIYYRGEFDSTLARIKRPKYPYGLGDLPGREQ